MYGKDEEGADTVVWLGESKDETDQSQPGIGQSSIAHETIEALRQLGLLDDILVTKEGLWCIRPRCIKLPETAAIEAMGV